MFDAKTQFSLTILPRKLHQEIKPILLTGAGFSYGAKNVHGERLPLGKELIEMLVTNLLGYDSKSEEAKDLMGHTLSDVYEFVKVNNESQAKSFLIDLFSNCQPVDFHRTIANFPWQKIYTFNIDDLMENSVPMGYLNVISTSIPMKRSPHNTVDYIKLHGCVRNHSADFVFSNSEYIRTSIGNDFRFADFVRDACTEDFVIIGASGVEPDIETYFARYRNSDKTPQGNFFYVDPYPDAIVRSKIERAGAHLIRITASEFAAWLEKETKDIRKGRIAVSSAQFKKSFRDVGEYIRKHQNSDNTTTRLYEGENPTWLDIISGYDFSKAITSTILDYINGELLANDCHLVIPMLSKAIGGKSVQLKRLGFELYSQGIEVYELINDSLNVQSFIDFTSRTPGNVIALLIDNGSSFYSSINRLVEQFPNGKRLIVLIAARPYFHQKKYYELRHLPGYKVFALDDISTDSLLTLAQSAVTTLKEKGLLGTLKAMSHQERLRHFRKNDLPNALWKVFHGVGLKKRFERSYQSIIRDTDRRGDESWSLRVAEILFAFALFNQRELSHVPDIVLSLWLEKGKERLLMQVADLIKPIDNKGMALRTDMLNSIIINSTERSVKMKVIREILRVIAPFVGRDNEYFNQIQGRLMNELFLRKNLKLPAVKVKELLTKLLKYYDENHNYFIQLGRAEQALGHYSLALNHLQQAEILAPGSYNVKNSIARNYLKQAYDDSRLTQDEATAAYDTGRRIMLDLISHREQYQVRAYSIHSLVVESVKYWRKFDLTPSAEEYNELAKVLHDAIGEYREDSRFNHAVQVLHGFAKQKQIKYPFPETAIEKLVVMKAVLTQSDSKLLISDDFPEQEEI